MASIPLFREEDHPRANDGKFTDKGSGSGSGTRLTPVGQMSPKRRENLAVRMGRKDQSPHAANLHPKVREAFFAHFQHIVEVERREREQGYPKGMHGPEWQEMVKADNAMLQVAQSHAREDEEKQHGSKLESERQYRKRKRMEKKLDDLENHIDSLEERYADRDGGSITDLKFPSPEAKAEYDELRRQRDRLEKELYGG